MIEINFVIDNVPGSNSKWERGSLQSASEFGC